MRRKATGEVRWGAEGATTRIRVGGGLRKPFALPTCSTDEEADARSAVLSQMARRFRRAGVIETEDARRLLDMAATATPSMLAGVLAVAAELVGGVLAVDGEPSNPTFEQVSRMWTSGELHERFPDHVGPLTENFRETVIKRLEKAVHPVIGFKLVAAVSRADCDEVMRQLPVPRKKKELSRETRRQYAGLVSRVLNLAELAGYIPRNPLPRGWLPKPGPRKRFPILYPSEDRTLLACEEIPLCFRMLWGFLHREGMRRGEAVDVRWYELDLEHGVVTLDENKTDNARWWRLGEGVAEALFVWKAMCGDVAQDDRVFVDEHGRPLTIERMAERCREHLQLAGIHRPDLFSTGANKGRFGTHGFRRSFVTRSLAIGMAEDWVRARSGHKSMELLRYRQSAKGLAELGLGEVDPLSLAIPEVAGWGKAHPSIAPKTTREGGGTGRRTSLRC